MEGTVVGRVTLIVCAVTQGRLTFVAGLSPLSGEEELDLYEGTTMCSYSGPQVLRFVGEEEGR